ncbi:MAG: hypothetical protein ACYTHM_07965 [Planctomycetota bacterium]
MKWNRNRLDWKAAFGLEVPLASSACGRKTGTARLTSSAAG